MEIDCQGETASYAFIFPAEFNGRVLLVHPDTSASLNDGCPMEQADVDGRKVYNLTMDITDDDSIDTLPCKKANLKIYSEVRFLRQRTLDIVKSLCLFTFIEYFFIFQEILFR